jgi:hypothetical protein
MYRAVSTLIVLFWLTMTALLLRNEIKPGDSALREVPPGHVVKLMLHHHNKSELNIVGDKTRLGHVEIMPQSRKEDGMREIAFKGWVHFTEPGGDRQRVAWDGEIEMDKDLTIHRFRLGVVMHEGGKLRSEVVVLPGENVAHYTLSSATGVLEKQDYTLDERGAHNVMQQLGVDSTMLPMGTTSKTQAPVVKAQQSSIDVHGDRLDTYLVSVSMNGQTLLECHVDQLGHVVKASTIFGYGLMSNTME